MSNFLYAKYSRFTSQIDLSSCVADFIKVELFTSSNQICSFFQPNWRGFIGKIFKTKSFNFTKLKLWSCIFAIPKFGQSLYNFYYIIALLWLTWINDTKIHKFLRCDIVVKIFTSLLLFQNFTKNFTWFPELTTLEFEKKILKSFQGSEAIWFTGL